MQDLIEEEEKKPHHFVVREKLKKNTRELHFNIIGCVLYMYRFYLLYCVDVGNILPTSCDLDILILCYFKVSTS